MEAKIGFDKSLVLKYHGESEPKIYKEKGALFLNSSKFILLVREDNSIESIDGSRVDFFILDGKEGDKDNG